MWQKTAALLCCCFGVVLYTLGKSKRAPLPDTAAEMESVVDPIMPCGNVTRRLDETPTSASRGMDDPGEDGDGVDLDDSVPLVVKGRGPRSSQALRTCTDAADSIPTCAARCSV